MLYQSLTLRSVSSVVSPCSPMVQSDSMTRSAADRERTVVVVVVVDMVVAGSAGSN